MIPVKNNIKPALLAPKIIKIIPIKINNGYNIFFLKYNDNNMIQSHIIGA